MINAQDRPARILIVEDEILIADTLQRYLEEGGHNVVGTATSSNDCIALIEQNAKPDIVLLDFRIEGERDGIDLAHWIRENHPEIARIFVTSQYDEHYFERVKGSFPAGYLTKPIQRTTLLATIGVTLNNLNRTPKTEEAKLFLKDGNENHVLLLDDLLFLHADHVYVEYHKKDKSIVTTRETFQAALDRLPSNDFIQIHRSYIINLKHLKSWTSTTVLVNDTSLPISRGRRNDLKLRLANRPEG
ncbi:MAG: LytR/AlgR family response regulator transcription factor [Saprospiraceae bacterium]